MYENFILKRESAGKIEGYSWKLGNPHRVICIIHGIGEYGGRFDRVAEAFRRSGSAVLSMDLRGHGNSMGKKGHCAPRREVLGDVSDLIRYAQHEYPQKDIILYGHSMGGNIVLDYRNRGELNDVPVGYIISAPWVRLVRPVPKPVYMLVKILSKAVPSFTIGSEVKERDLGNPDSVKPYKDNPMVHNRISALCAVDGFETGLMLEDGTLQKNGKAKDIPMLMMHGKEDRICSIEGSRKIAQRLEKEEKNFRYIEWENLCHEIHNGGEESKGDEVIEKMIEWIEAL